MSLLKNKIAVVTGGNSGIGLATAKRFVEEGVHVFIAGRRQAELDKAVREIGKNVTGVKTDISKLYDLDRFYEAVAKKGKIDVIFCWRGLRRKADDRHGDRCASARSVDVHAYRYCHRSPRHRTNAGRRTFDTFGVVANGWLTLAFVMDCHTR